MTYYSIHFNRPDFVEIQYKLISKQKNKLVVINNGLNPHINGECERLGIECHNVSNVGSNSLSHGSALNFAVSNVINFNEEWALIDHDYFPLYNVEFEQIGCDIITAEQNNVKNFPYLNPAMLFCRSGIDVSNIDFRPGVGISGDTGCGTYVMFGKYSIKNLKLEYYGGEFSESSPAQRYLIELIYLGDILFGIHYLCGSNWIGNSNLEHKNNLLNSLISEYI